MSCTCQTFGEAPCIRLLNPFQSLTALIIKQINDNTTQIQHKITNKIPYANPFSPDCEIFKQDIALIKERSKKDTGARGKNDKIMDIIFCGIDIIRNTFRWKDDKSDDFPGLYIHNNIILAIKYPLTQSNNPNCIKNPINLQIISELVIFRNKY
jgi:hypothetical protein